MSKGRRITCTGCLIGCGVLVLIFILTSIGTAYWLTKKGSFESETTILSSESEFFVHMMLRAEDKILVDFFSNLAEKANQDNPVFNRFPFLERWNQKKTRKDILQMLPLKMEFTGRVMENDFRGSVGFSFYNNAASLTYALMSRLMRKEGHSIDFQGSNYLRFIEGDDKVFVSLNQSLLYVTNSEAGMRDLLENKDRPVAAHVMEPLLGGLDLTKPIYGYLTGRAINVSWWPQAQFSREEETFARQMFSSDKFSRVTFGVYVESETTLGLQALFAPVDGGFDEATQEWIRLLPGQLFDEGSLDIDSRVEQTEQGYLLDVTFSGFENLVPTHQTISF